MKNEGKIERTIQTTISAGLLFSSIMWAHGAWKIVLVIFALMIGFFATIGFCPLYAIIGKNTSKNKNNQN